MKKLLRKIVIWGLSLVGAYVVLLTVLVVASVLMEDRVVDEISERLLASRWTEVSVYEFMEVDAKADKALEINTDIGWSLYQDFAAFTAGYLCGEYLFVGDIDASAFGRDLYFLNEGSEAVEALGVYLETLEEYRHKLMVLVELYSEDLTEEDVAYAGHVWEDGGILAAMSVISALEEGWACE